MTDNSTPSGITAGRSDAGGPPLISPDGTDIQVWRRTLTVALIAQVTAMMGFSFAMPFLPLFLRELGIADETKLRIWSGYVSAAPGFMMMISAPLWGILADRVGRKAMVIRATFGGAVIIALMSAATTPSMLLGLRLVQGIFTGTVSASAALVASVSPRNRAGFSLGLMSTAAFVGNSIGPLIGGHVAERYGNRITFVVGGIMLFLAGLLVMAFAHEGRPADSRSKTPEPEETLREILGRPGVTVVLGLVGLMAAARTVLAPVLTLYVEQITGPVGAKAATGQLLALTSLMTALTAIPAGWLADRHGSRVLLVAGTLMGGLFCVPQAFVTGMGQFFGLSALLGVAVGTSSPAGGRFLQTTVARRSHGKAFGLSQSATSFGFAIGPLIGGYLAAWLGLAMPFVITGVAQFLLGLIAWWALARVPGADGGNPTPP